MDSNAYQGEFHCTSVCDEDYLSDQAFNFFNCYGIFAECFSNSIKICGHGVGLDWHDENIKWSKT